MKLRKKQLGFIGDLIQAAASLGGGFMSNQANKKEAAKQRAFQEVSTTRQMDFQRVANQKAMDFSERMSSSAHQREVKDLRLAGLNPILSSKYGGSSTPSGVSSGGASSSGAKAQIQDIVTPAVQTYIAARQNKAQVNNIRAATTNVKADTQLKNAQKIRTMEQANLSVEDRFNRQVERGKMRASVMKTISETRNVRQRLRLIQVETGISREQLKQLVTKFPGLRNEEKVSRSTFGQAMAYIHRVFKKPSGPNVQRAIIVRGK